MYSRGQEKIPHTWKLQIGDFTLVLHRHIHYEPDDWLMSFENVINKKLLKSKDVEEAKAEALGIIKRIFEKAMKDLNDGE
jgi:hypothetical protein